MQYEALKMMAAAGLFLAGCGDSGDAPAAAMNAAGQPAANATAPSANVAVEAKAAAPAAPTYTLAGDGLGPGLGFGVAQARAIELATAAFGAPTRRERTDCPQGPMDVVRFQHLSLMFEDGRFTGWSLDGSPPELRTEGGLVVGMPRSALGDIEITEDEMGVGFNVGEVSGLLDENGTRVASLSAGSICFWG